MSFRDHLTPQTTNLSAHPFIDCGERGGQAVRIVSVPPSSIHDAPYFVTASLDLADQRVVESVLVVRAQLAVRAAATMLCSPSLCAVPPQARPPAEQAPVLKDYQAEVARLWGVIFSNPDYDALISRTPPASAPTVSI